MTGQQRTQKGVRPLLIVAALFAAIGAYAEFRSVPSVVQWRTLDDALAESRATGKPVYLDVYAAWCAPCKHMDARTFTNDTVRSLLSRLYVPARINIDSDTFTDSLRDRWRINGVPTSLVLNYRGVDLRRRPGFIPPTAFIDWLSDFSLSAFGSWDDFPTARERARTERKPLLVVLAQNSESTEEVAEFFVDSTMRAYVGERFVPTYLRMDDRGVELAHFINLPVVPERGMVLNVFSPEMRLLGSIPLSAWEFQDQARVVELLGGYLK